MTIRNKEVSVSKWMHNKKVVMTVSLVCAIIFWGIINVSESPNITRDIHNVPVVISLEGTAAKDVFDLDVVGGEERTVTVTVSGPRYIVAGLTAEDIEKKFGFLVEAYKYGAPPHGGSGMGLDRLAMVMTGADSLRDVIAFPKVQNASELMSGCPAPADPKALEDLSIAVIEEEQ